MTKQGKIRKGLKDLFYEMGLGESIDHEAFSQRVLSYLHSQGVVIEVDRELPKADRKGFWGDVVNETIRKLNKVGYVAVEPLIKEGR